MATVAPSGMSATACSGDAKILSMAIVTSSGLARPRRPHRLVVAERDRRPGPARRRLGEANHWRQMAEPTDRRVARHRPALQLLGREFLRDVLELGLVNLTASDEPAPGLGQ